MMSYVGIIHRAGINSMKHYPSQLVFVSLYEDNKWTCIIGEGV